MRYTITGRNIEVTPGLRAMVEKKIGKLEHFFTPDTEVIVALSAQKDRQKIEVTIPIKGNTIRAEESSTDMYVSIDLVEEVIERQIRRYRKKLIDKKTIRPLFLPGLYGGRGRASGRRYPNCQNKEICHQTH